MQADITLTNQEQTELLTLRRYYPFRLCFAAKKQGEETQYWAKPTRHKLNSMIREGWTVFLASSDKQAG